MACSSPLHVDILPSSQSTFIAIEDEMGDSLPVPPSRAHLSRPPSYDVHLAMQAYAEQPSVELRSSVAPPPPEYAEVPQTRAEQLFWYGFVMPLLWLPGALYLVRSQDPLTAARAKDPGAQLVRTKRWRIRRNTLAVPELEEPAMEMKALWRVEEKTWAKRCLRGFTSFILLLALILLVVLYTKTS